MLGEKELRREGVAEVVGRRGLGVGFCGAATETTPRKKERERERGGGRQLSKLALSLSSFLWGVTVYGMKGESW